MSRDRFGIGWRPELAASIFAAMDRIDVLEVLADGYFSASRRQLRGLRTLARQVPVTLHATSLGLASCCRVEPVLLDRMARVAGEVEPESWSEHLAFVRAGGIEIGHLAAPPRTPLAVEGTAENVMRARLAVGNTPALENIATIPLPPGVFDEGEWLAHSLHAANCPLLLDLHNLHANALNHGFDAAAILRRLPLECVHTVHIAGGQWIGDGNERRLVDDHLHPVPDAVCELLAELAALCPNPLTIILERDGSYPAFAGLLAELDLARGAVHRGRARRAALGHALVPPAEEAGT